MADKEDSKGPQFKGVSRRQFITRTAAGTAGAIALTTVLDACGGSSSSTPTALSDAQALNTGAWKFGVISDTQWIQPDDGFNPNTSAVAIAVQVQQQLIAQGVAFAVHVGDLCDIDTLSTTSGAANDGNLNPATNAMAGEYTRALYSQALYNAGIGFFPLRGNHDEDYNPGGATAFPLCYPQTLNGQHTNPSAVLSKFNVSGVSADEYLNADAGNNPVPANSGSNFTIGSNFSSPNPSYAIVNGVNGLAGLTYSFDYNGARFMLLDQFAPSNGAYPYSQMDASIGGNSSASYASFFGSAQQPWISQQLNGRSGSHSFVFAHKGLVTGNHADNLFSTSGGNCSQNPAAQNAFMSSLYSNGVRMYMNGHDHMHDRSIVTSPDGKSTVMQMTCASDSSKFYGPQGSASNNNTVFPYGSTTPVSTLALSRPSAQMSNDIYWNVQQAGGKARRQVLSQELYTVGYYIYTVNGALVTVDYYSADVPAYPNSTKPSEFMINTAQGLNFVKRESWGYGLNGQQFVIASGQPYSVVQDKSSAGTTAKILSGTNACTTTDACYLPYTKLVTTGWASASAGSLSDIVALRGINPWVGASNPDTYVLSMATNASLTKSMAICALDSNGNWTTAVNQIASGTRNFVYGPWNSSYGLGTYGIDPTTNTAWAVLNYDGMFAIGIAS